MDAIHTDQIEKLYIEMYDRLMVYARSSLRNESLAEEAVQDTFRIACQKPEELCDSPNPQGWLVQTLRNTIRNTKRHLALAQQLMDHYLAHQYKPSSDPEDHLDFDLLYENMIKTEAFQLLAQLVIEKKSYKQIAQEQGVSIDACRKRMQRARENLQKMIEE